MSTRLSSADLRGMMQERSQVPTSSDRQTLLQLIRSPQATVMICSRSWRTTTLPQEPRRSTGIGHTTLIVANGLRTYLLNVNHTNVRLFCIVAIAPGAGLVECEFPYLIRGQRRAGIKSTLTARFCRCRIDHSVFCNCRDPHGVLRIVRESD